MEGELEWEVEEVVGYHLMRNGRRRYKVKWAGTPQTQWLPEEEMGHCTRVLREYFEREGLPLPSRSIGVLPQSRGGFGYK